MSSQNSQSSPNHMEAWDIDIGRGSWRKNREGERDRPQYLTKPINSNHLYTSAPWGSKTSKGIVSKILCTNNMNKHTYGYDTIFLKYV